MQIPNFTSQRNGAIYMQKEAKEVKEEMPRVVERMFEGEQKLESILILWLKKQTDGEQN
jgi:hypothetical protein